MLRCGKIVQVVDNIWTCLFLKENHVFIGELIKLVDRNGNEVFGIVFEFRGGYEKLRDVDVSYHKVLDPKLLKQLLNEIVVFVKVVVVGSDSKNPFDVGHIGGNAIPTGDVLKIRVGHELLGNDFHFLDLLFKDNKVKDVLSLPLKEQISFDTLELERDAPGIIDRSPVHAPVLTGVPAIDCFIPIGKGQRQLILGDHGTGRTTLALTILLNQKRINRRYHVNQCDSKLLPLNVMACVLVFVGKRKSEIARIKKLLQNYNVLSYTCILYTSASDLAGAQYLVPFAGTSIAEWFMLNSRHSLVIYDDLSEQAVAYREVSLFLRRPPGREAYPGDIFYLHSRLLERAAQLSITQGGGSLTSLPIVETKLGDITGYIPTNVISICDGQILLTKDVSLRPAIDLGLSVSRVGSKAQPPMVASISSTVRKTYHMYNKYKGVERVGGDLHFTYKKYVDRGYRLDKFMTQPPYKTISLYKEVVFMYLLSNDAFDRLSVKYTDVFLSLLSSKNYIERVFNLKYRTLLDCEVEFESCFLSHPLSMIESDLKTLCNAVNVSFRKLSDTLEENPKQAERVVKAAKEADSIKLLQLSDPSVLRKY